MDVRAQSAIADTPLETVGVTHAQGRLHAVAGGAAELQRRAVDVMDALSLGRLDVDVRQHGIRDLDESPALMSRDHEATAPSSFPANSERRESSLVRHLHHDKGDEHGVPEKGWWHYRTNMESPPPAAAQHILPNIRQRACARMSLEPKWLRKCSVMMVMYND